MLLEGGDELIGDIGRVPAFPAESITEQRDRVNTRPGRLSVLRENFYVYCSVTFSVP